MTQDVEMNDTQAAVLSVSVTSAAIPAPIHQLKEIHSLLESGAYAREVRRIAHAVRLTMGLRRKLTASVISTFLSYALNSGSEVHFRISSYLPKEDDHDMEVDTATSVIRSPGKHLLAEIETYCYLLVLIFLIDQKKYNDAKACSTASIARLKNLNKRSVDVLASRLYYYYSLSYELTGNLSEIRGNLLNLHRIATLRHDELGQEDDHDMEVDTATSVIRSPGKHLLAEIETYCYLLVLIFLIDQKKYNDAKACSTASIARLKNLNKRSVDVLASRLYYYYSLSYELTGNLSEIRGNLLNLHRIATLRHDELGQETLLNLLLRNYLHYNLYDQAEKLRSKAPRFEAHSNQQFCRYLFYLGKIRTTQLEYTDAKESLLQAARKAPVAALGFRIQCNKWAIIVRLLLGEIPERTVFMQKGMEKALRPYFELTNAVRIGDLELFKNVADKFSTTYHSDRTHNLIVRLHHNVIRTGLRNISISYSRISLVDVANKLHLDSPNPVADAENIVAKAIRDGAIDATLDRANGCMVSKETGDIYSTIEPQSAFDSRITFCLNMHNDAVRALRFPPNSHKEKESAEKRRERQQQEQELAQHIAEEDDDDF